MSQYPQRVQEAGTGQQTDDIVCRSDLVVDDDTESLSYPFNAVNRTRQLSSRSRTLHLLNTISFDFAQLNDKLNYSLWPRRGYA